MTRSSEIRNVTASVRQRLLNRARAEGLDYNLVLQRYGTERFLYRLGISSEVDRFTLKGVLRSKRAGNGSSRTRRCRGVRQNEVWLEHRQQGHEIGLK